MNTLRKVIRRLILESTGGAKTVADLPEDARIIVKGNSNGGCDVLLYFSDREDFDPSGRASTLRTSNSKVHQLGALYTDMDPRASGFGPLLSDIAMEWTTKVAKKWLTIDRRTVSDDAQRTWQYYKDNRLGVDVEGLQLDNKANLLTKKKSDNVEATMADEVMMGFGSDYWSANDQEQYQKDFYRENAMMWAFKKQPDVIPQLLDLPNFQIHRW